MDPFTDEPEHDPDLLARAGAFKSSAATAHGMSTSMSTASSHPLAHQLSALRAQLSQVQRAAHTQGMLLQGRVLEATLANEAKERAEGAMRSMEREMEVLRSNAGLPAALAEDPTTAPSTALSSLTLAHRRLSALLTAAHERAAALSHALAASEAAVYAATQRADRAEQLLAGERARTALLEEELRRAAAEERRAEEEGRVGRLALKEAMERLERYEGKEGRGGAAETVFQAEAEDEVDQRELHEVQEKTGPGEANGDSTATPYIVNMQETAKLDSPRLDNDSGAHTRGKTHLVDLATTSLPSTPSNILQGITGIRRLFLDFTTQLSQQAGTITALEARAGDAEAQLEVYRGMEEEERTRRVGVEDELVRMREADEGASQLVERYMAFSQKQASQLHGTLLSQTARLNATIATLRASLLTTSRDLAAERTRTESLRAAMDELAAGYEREVVGRRREVALRIRALEREERWAERGERWRERVRRERNRLGSVGAGEGHGYGMGAMQAARASSSSLASVSAAVPSRTSSPMPTPSRNMNQESTGQLWELLESGLALFASPDSPLSGVDLDVPVEPTDGYPDGLYGVDARTGRNVLAWDIYATLLQELEEETQRRVVLEKERSQIVDHVGANGDAKRHMQDGVPTSEDASEVNVDLSQPSEREVPVKYSSETGPIAQLDALGPVDAEQTPRSEAVATMETVRDLAGDRPELTALRDRLSHVSERYSGLQKSLHDCAHSLTTLRASAAKLEPLPCAASSLASAKQLGLLLDGVHDVVEDVRVEVEIAIADDERVATGLQTLLTLQSDDKSLASAEAFLGGRDKGARTSTKRIAGFQRRLADVEHDLIQLKVAQAQLEAGEEEDVEEVLDDSPGFELPRRRDVLAAFHLRTVAAPVPTVLLDSPMTSPGSGVHPGNGMKRGFFGSLGRTLTGTTPNGSSSSVDSLQRVSSMGGFRNASLGAGSVGIMGGSGAAPLSVPSPQSERSHLAISPPQTDDDVE